MTNLFIGNWESIWVCVSGVKHRAAIVINSDIDGVYEYHEERTRLVRGNLSNGTLEHGNRTFSGVWNETDVATAENISGEFQFRLSYDGLCFHGDWKLDSKRDYFDWFGHRVGSRLVGKAISNQEVITD